MIRAFALLLTVALLAVLAPLASGASQTPCGNAGSKPSSPQDVRTEGVDCATGKRLARRHANRTGKGKRCDLRRTSCSLDGWRCRRSFFGDAGTKVTCTLSFGRVTWIYGV